jgi:C1A family cysteine protease
LATAPDKIDWSANAVTPVKDQNECGSCWAFSTIEGVESAIYRSTGKLPPPLSTQELVACEKDDFGCDGGDLVTAVAYLQKKGVATEKNYPDTSSKHGKTGKCKSFKKTYTVHNMSYAVPACTGGTCPTDEEKLAAAVAKFGPLSICVNSGTGQPSEWLDYVGGVLTKTCTAEFNRMDHCVQLVGYDKTGGGPGAIPYWKIKNSWGTSWGENGYMRLAYNNSNMCCVGCEAVIITADPA